MSRAVVQSSRTARDALDRARINRYLLTSRIARLASGHEHARLQIELGHGVAKRGHFPLPPGPRVHQGLAHLDQHPRAVRHAGAEVHFPSRDR